LSVLSLVFLVFDCEAHGFEVERDALGLLEEVEPEVAVMPGVAGLSRTLTFWS
jgi:hypothetical protein